MCVEYNKSKKYMSTTSGISQQQRHLIFLIYSMEDIDIVDWYISLLSLIFFVTNDKYNYKWISYSQTVARGIFICKISYVQCK
jgi:hypothetical protein